MAKKWHPKGIKARVLRRVSRFWHYNDPATWRRRVYVNLGTTNYPKPSLKYRWADRKQFRAWMVETNKAIAAGKTE